MIHLNMVARTTPNNYPSILKERRNYVAGLTVMGFDSHRNLIPTGQALSFPLAHRYTRTPPTQWIVRNNVYRKAQQP